MYAKVRSPVTKCSPPRWNMPKSQKAALLDALEAIVVLLIELFRQKQICFIIFPLNSLALIGEY